MEKDMTIKIKYSRTDKIVLGIGYTLLGLFVLAIIVPLVYVVLASFMDPTVLNNQGLSFNVKDWTIDAYRRVLEVQAAAVEAEAATQEALGGISKILLFGTHY